jgi:glycosyltransferase involved in cell wall biosynthesis
MKRARPNRDAFAKVSILIPAYYSDDTLADCLTGLRQQQFRDFEVILVNSSPEDATRRLVERQFPEVVFEQSPTRLLPHAARNRAATRARGDILVFTDPDCWPHPDWLARLVEAHSNGHQLLCGAIELRDKTGDWFACGVHLCKYSFRLSRLPAGYTHDWRNRQRLVHACGLGIGRPVRRRSLRG